MENKQESERCSKCGEAIVAPNSLQEFVAQPQQQQQQEELELSQEQAKSENGPTPNPGDGKRKHGHFARAVADLRRKWGRRGVEEIDLNHPRYLLTSCIKFGLQESFKKAEVSEVNAKTEMTGEDFAAVDVCHDTYENSKKFQFRSYAPKVFTKLRQLINLDEESYRSSMVPSQGLPYLEFLSNSKSGMSFFLCNNKMLMIKTEKPDDITFFRSILKQYLHHFEKYPHSLMVKILGLHYIHVEGHKPRYFTVMQSVFFPDERIFERYDLKGCHASRYTEPEPEGSQIITILKDNNLKGTTINIGSQREWFLTQIQHDTNFLAEIGVMDYSLLLGRQHIHYTERREEDKFADIVLRLQKSVPLKTSAFGVLCEKCKEQNRLALANDKLQIRESGDSDSQGCEEIETKRESDTQQAGQSGESRNGVRPGGCTTPSSVDVNSDLPKADGDSRNSRSAKKLFSSAINTDTVLPGMIPGTPKISSASEEDTNETTSNQIVDFDKVKERNQRLLPDIENALHVIDGEEERYFLGIIDIFTQYKMKKKLEHVYKAFRFPCTSFSTVAPVAYAGRFRNFMEEHSE